MKIGVMADSHDHVAKIEATVDHFVDSGVDYVFHAGDFVSPFAVKPLYRLRCPVLAVFGNNDGERRGLVKKLEEIGRVHDHFATVELAERTIAMVHYPELAEPLARCGLYDLVIFGHTHNIEHRNESAHLLNPGEVGGWLTGRSTAAIVDLVTMEVEIFDV